MTFTISTTGVAMAQGLPERESAKANLRIVGGELYRVEGVYQVRATAYTAGPESTGKQPGDAAYGVTRLGTQVQEGRTIAVDPRRIALGSTVYIRGWGLYVAEDTGGAIRGDRIDVYMEDLDEALEFGVRELQVEIVTPLRLYANVWQVMTPSTRSRS